MAEEVSRLKAKLKELREELYKSQSREKLLRRESAERMLGVEAQFESQLHNLQSTINVLEQECSELKDQASKHMSESAALLMEKDDCIRELKRKNGKWFSPAIPTTLENVDFKHPKPVMSSTDQQQFCISSQNPLKSHAISATELKLYQSC